MSSTAALPLIPLTHTTSPAQAARTRLLALRLASLSTSPSSAGIHTDQQLLNRYIQIYSPTGSPSNSPTHRRISPKSRINTPLPAPPSAFDSPLSRPRALQFRQLHHSQGGGQPVQQVTPTQQQTTQSTTITRKQQSQQPQTIIAKTPPPNGVVKPKLPSSSSLLQQQNTDPNAQRIVLYSNNQSRRFRIQAGVISLQLFCWPYLCYLPFSSVWPAPMYVAYLGFGGMFVTLLGLCALNMYARHYVSSIMRVGGRYDVQTHNILGRIVTQRVLPAAIHHGKLNYATAISGNSYKFRIGKQKFFYVLSKDGAIYDNDAVSKFLRYDIAGSNLHASAHPRSGFKMIAEDQSSAAAAKLKSA